MKTLCKAMLAIGIFLSFFQQSYATHVAGGDITVKCLSPHVYIVTANFFRDCTGIPPAPNPINCSFESECGQQFTVQLPLMNPPFGQEVSQLCPSQLVNSTCNGGGLPGMQYYFYSDTVDLNASTGGNAECPRWSISYSIPTRNNSINCNGCLSQNFFVESELNTKDFDCNNSPIFTSNPIPYVCSGQAVNYSFGVIEPDGDFLTYHLDTAFQSLGNSIVYANGYTPSEPIPGATIDTATGQLNFLPTMPLGSYIFVVKVREYDPITMKFKGSVKRDIQVIVQQCDNLVPVNVGGITNFNGTGAQEDSNSISVCVGETFDFDIIFFDFDTSGNLSNDSVTVTTNITQILPGATFTTTGTNPVTANVSWVASLQNGSFYPFNFFAQDDACPIYGIATTTYDLTIVPPTSIGPDSSFCASDTLKVRAVGGDHFTWQSIVGPPLVVGTNISCDTCQEVEIFGLNGDSIVVVVTSDLSPSCKNSDTATYISFNAYPIDASGIPKDFCVTDGLDTFGIGVNTPAPSSTHQWFGPGVVNIDAGIFAPDVVGTPIGTDSTFNIILKIDTTCPSADTFAVTVHGLPNTEITFPGPLCELDNSIQLTSAVPGGTWSGQGIIDPNAGTINPSLFTAPDSVTVYYTINDPFCSNLDSATFDIISTFNSNIDSLPKVCVGDTTPFRLNNFEFDPGGEWQGDHIIEVPDNSGNYFFDPENLPPGNYKITYAHLGTCGSFTQDTLKINQAPNTAIIASPAVFCDHIEDSVKLDAFIPNGIWGGNLVAANDGFFIPSKVGVGTYTVTHEFYDQETSCFSKDEVEIRISPTPPRPKIYDNSPYCSGDILENLRADGLLSNEYRWYTKGDTTDTCNCFIGVGNPFYYGPVDNTFSLFATQVSEDGCESIPQEVVIDVIPSPFANFFADPPKGIKPLTVDFTNLSGPDSGNYTVTWDMNDGSALIFEQNPTHVFTELGIYNVTLTADNGFCTDKFNARIVVDGSSNIVIPNIFTPNGDGANDFFQVWVEGMDNYELTIFNRWGRKVFQTNDINEFWDGGDEPDGVYFYIVTGTEQTLEAKEVKWNGDVTLIRGN